MRITKKVILQYVLFGSSFFITFSCQETESNRSEKDTVAFDLAEKCEVEPITSVEKVTVLESSFETASAQNNPDFRVVLDVPGPLKFTKNTCERDVCLRQVEGEYTVENGAKILFKKKSYIKTATTAAKELNDEDKCEVSAGLTIKGEYKGHAKSHHKINLQGLQIPNCDLTGDLFTYDKNTEILGRLVGPVDDEETEDKSALLFTGRQEHSNHKALLVPRAVDVSTADKVLIEAKTLEIGIGDDERIPGSEVDYETYSFEVCVKTAVECGLDPLNKTAFYDPNAWKNLKKVIGSNQPFDGLNHSIEDWQKHSIELDLTSLKAEYEDFDASQFVVRFRVEMEDGYVDNDPLAKIEDGLLFDDFSLTTLTYVTSPGEGSGDETAGGEGSCGDGPGENEIVCPTDEQLIGNTCQPIDCDFGFELQGNTCVEINCEFGTELNSTGTACVDINCEFGTELNSTGTACVDINCEFGTELNSIGTACVDIICPLGQRLNAAGTACEAYTCDFPTIFDGQGGCKFYSSCQEQFENDPKYNGFKFMWGSHSGYIRSEEAGIGLGVFTRYYASIGILEAVGTPGSCGLTCRLGGNFSKHSVWPSDPEQSGLEANTSTGFCQRLLGSADDPKYSCEIETPVIACHDSNTNPL